MAIPRIAAYPMPASLPANKVSWPLQPGRALLLVHDMQDYFLDFYDNTQAPIPSLLANAGQLIDAARAEGVPVVYTAQLPEQTAAERGLLQDMWGPGLTARPERKDIVAALAPQTGDRVLDKWRYSAFQRSPLLEMMRNEGRDQLIICGVYAHIGCMMTACEAFMNEIQPFFAADALADFSQAEHEMALRYVAQRCGMVLDTASLLGQLAPLPATPEALRTLVARLLGVNATELDPQDNLLDWGLDSIRIMSLLERFRRAGCELSFTTLAEQATLAAWWALLQAPTRQAA